MPYRSLKFYLKMTRHYRQNRTKLFLPIRGKQDISESSVSRWISYNIKFAYRKLIRKAFSLKSKPMKLGLYFHLEPFSVSFAQGDSISNMESIFYIFAKLCLSDMSLQL